MRKISSLCYAFVACAGLAILAGCKPAKTPTSTSSSGNTSGALDPVLGPVQAGRKAAQKLVTAKEFDDLKIYINDASLVSGQMPTKEEITAACKAGYPKLYQAIQDGQIVLTGTRSREGVWAYEKDAPTAGGFVLTSSGVERLTAQELQQRLQQN